MQNITLIYICLMLVPAMTLEEMRREAARDMEILWRKANYVEHDLRRLHRKIREGEIIHRSFNYFSKYKNKWIYSIELHKKESFYAFISYFYGSRGLVAVSLIRDNNKGIEFMIYCTAHFFKRFNERRSLGLTLPEDIIRAFQNDARNFHLRRLNEFAPGMHEMFCITETGVILGIANDNLRVIKMNTFLTKEMLRGSQKEMMQEISEHLYKYKFKGVWENLDE